MTIEGLWTIDFFSKHGAGAGVIVFETGRVFGGDSSMFYIGDYEIKNGAVSGRIRVRVHHRIPGLTSIAGADDFEVEYSAQLSDATTQLTGKVIDASANGRIIHGSMRKLAELP